MGRRNNIIAAVLTLGIVLAAVVLVAAAVVVKNSQKSGTTASTTPLVDTSTLNQLPKKNASAAYTGRIDSSLIPPTNSWLSGMVLQKIPLPVFPMPLSFLAKDTGFEIGLPTVSSTATVISGEHTPGISAAVTGATRFVLTRYDKVSATLTYKNNAKTLGALTLAEGSPFVFFRSDDATSISLSGAQAPTLTSSYARYTTQGHTYAVAAFDGAQLSSSGSGIAISAPKGSLVTFYALPSDGSDPLKALAGNELASVTVSDSTDSSESLTHFDYKTANGKPTAFVPMNYETVLQPPSPLTTYDSMYGPMPAFSGNQFTIAANLARPSNQLDLSQLTSNHKNAILSALKIDASSAAVTANDSYYAGKQLARVANLLDIAEQLHQSDVAAHLKSVLNDAFSKRLNGHYFYYDSVLKGVAAQTAAFGSQDFNDHHFHYGYFIYAASILGKYDNHFLQTYKNQVNLLVADIASYQSSSLFPIERYYDPYAAHSWAAGLAPFADGNNQESSSEAVNAWNGVALWGKLINNAELQQTGVWMLSNEQSTAQHAWRSVSINAPYLKNFSSPLTSLNFGGKRTYATFFSDQPNTKLGIQLIPMNPMMKQDTSDGSNIQNVLSASISSDNYNVALGDYDLMYLSLSDPQKAAQLLPKQQSSFIDDGDSQTYLDAWIYSLVDAKK